MLNRNQVGMTNIPFSGLRPQPGNGKRRAGADVFQEDRVSEGIKRPRLLRGAAAGERSTGNGRKDRRASVPAGAI